jgi:prepilin-type N-terminal cleavage/methylation domain-containing protein
MQKTKGFTLIELIIVVVIIGILALVAIPRYFANVAKAQKSQVYANLDALRQVTLSYYAVYGIYPTTNAWPITVTVDGDMVMSMVNPSNANWVYSHESTSSPPLYTYKQPGNSCWYGMRLSGEWLGTCTP